MLESSIPKPDPRHLGETFGRVRAERAEETYGVRRAIRVLKDAISIEDYAATVTALRPAGNTLRGPCPAHKGNNPESFAVYPDEGRFYCFNCNENGDLVDLARAVEGGETWEAVVSLATRYGVELPRRSGRWHTRQGDKARTREAAKRHVARVIQRRLTRIYSPLVLLGDESPGEELQELEELAAALWPVALAWADRRVCGGE